MDSVFSWKTTFESVFIARISPPGLCNVNNLAGNLFLKKTKPWKFTKMEFWDEVHPKTLFEIYG